MAICSKDLIALAAENSVGAVSWHEGALGESAIGNNIFATTHATDVELVIADCETSGAREAAMLIDISLNDDGSDFQRVLVDHDTCMAIADKCAALEDLNRAIKAKS